MPIIIKTSPFLPIYSLSSYVFTITGGRKSKTNGEMAVVVVDIGHQQQNMADMLDDSVVGNVEAAGSYY
jgi:hypothetical protein